jgi:ubiquinone/menaquinone biosynthesis C-methylase UbiE
MLDSFCHKIVSNYKVYDLVQKAAGGRRVRDRLASLMSDAENQSVLDVGAGTGALSPLLPRTCRYIWLDNDPEKLRGFRSRGGGLAVLGSAVELALASKSVDRTACIAVAHHLGDQELARALSEIARVTRNRLIFVDAIYCPSRPASRFLWSIDRGSHPRPPEVLQRFLEEAYVVEQAELLTVLHRYFLCVAVPRVATPVG